MQYTLNLPANTSIRQGTSGSFFLLTDTGAATSIDVTFKVHAQVAEHVTVAKRGLKATLQHGQHFTGIEFFSTVACVVTFIISDGVVDISQLDGANVNATIANALPLPVSNDRGSPGLPVYVNGTIAGVPTALAIADDAAVAVTAALTALVTANANRIRLIFTNLDATNPVTIGGAGLTWAKRAVVLNPGDTWIEDKAANLAWWAICNTALTASVAVQEVTA